MKYQEPVTGAELEFKLIPISKLRNAEFQRGVSKALVKSLSKSLTRGFTGILTVIENEEGLYNVLDGQHRLEGLKTILEESKEIPCIVVPRQYNFQPLIFNVEKGDNVKDLCQKLFKEYEWFVANKPNEKEGDVFNVVTLGRPYLLSLSYSYGLCNLQSPSLVENVAKKFDNFLDEEILKGRDIRVKRGQLLADVESKVIEICDEYNVKDFNLRKAIVSKTSTKLWGRKRSIDESFEDGISMLLNALEEGDFRWLMGV